MSYCPRQCQNLRNKVYGLLALVGNIADLDVWLTPDSSKSESEVFHNATVAMVYRDGKNLKCLIGAQYGAAYEKWASWDRNFGVSLTRPEANTESSRLMIHDLFDASRGREAEYQL